MRWRSEHGQASVELVAVLPLVLLVGAVLWQLVLAGHALWACANAARVAARAEAVGEPVEEAARSALPDALERSLEVEADAAGAVEVRVLVPFVLPQWRTPIPVTATARLEAGS